MSLFSKLFNKEKQTSVAKVGGMEDFMTLIRVYYQSVMAANLGISNISFLPDLRVFKQTLHVPTVNNKLGVGERSKCRKMLIDMYGMSDDFFKQIDLSIKKNCRNVNDIKNYLFMFQGFTQDLMMVVGSLMQWKFRLPSIFKKLLYTATQKTIHDILNKYEWSDEGVSKTCSNIRAYHERLGFSEQWMVEYVYKIVMLAKKEPKPSDEEVEKVKDKISAKN